MVDSEQAPRLNPARRASEDAIKEDLMLYGCAFVMNIDGEDWMLHPTQVSIYVDENEEL